MDIQDQIVQIAKEEGVDPQELQDFTIQLGRRTQRDVRRIANIMTYLRKHIFERKPKTVAFRETFPDRASTPMAVQTKIVRLESSAIFRKIKGLLSTSLYAHYALDRIKVLDKALEKIEEESIADRDRIGYMKLFLEETRKPDELKGMELNVNIQQNNISLQSVEERLEQIANKMVGADADQIIGALNNGKM